MKKIELFQQNHNRSQVDKGLETADKLAVSCSNTSEMLKFVEKALNQMPFLVLPLVAIPGVEVIVFGWYRVSRAVRSDIIANLLRAISLVAHYDASRDIRHGQYVCGNGAVVNVSASKEQLDQIANPIDKSVDFCILPSSRYTDTLVTFRS